MRPCTKYLWASALVLASMGPAFAQNQPAGAQTGRPGGAGVQAGGQIGANVNVPGFLNQPFYRNPDIRRMLNLDDQQFDRLNNSTTQLQTRFRTDFSRLGDLDANERANRLRTLTGDFRNQFLRSAGAVLNPEQMTRFRQLDLQNRGIDAFGDADVRRRLNLNDQQIRRFDDLNTRSTQQMNQFRELAGTNREQAMSRYQNFARTLQEERNRILTPEQQRTWQELIGDPFDFQPDFGNPNPPRNP
jgi:hypothetical protein